MRGKGNRVPALILINHTLTFSNYEHRTKKYQG